MKITDVQLWACEVGGVATFVMTYWFTWQHDWKSAAVMFVSCCIFNSAWKRRREFFA